MAEEAVIYELLSTRNLPEARGVTGNFVNLTCFVAVATNEDGGVPPVLRRDSLNVEQASF